MKSIIITGSIRGIGLAMVKELFQSGCNVILSSRKTELDGGIISELANRKNM